MIDKVNFGPDLLDPRILSKNLKELFPNGIFYRFLSSKDQPINDKTDLYRFIKRKKIDYKEKNALVLGMMEDDIFSALFPEKQERCWDELEAAINNGCPVIRFYINKINEKFLEGFNASVDKSVRSDKKPVTDVAELFDEAAFKRKTYLLDFDDAELFNICEHSPSSVYKAFEYYARKQYSLIRLGREFPIKDLYEKWKLILKSELPELKSKLSELKDELNKEIKSKKYNEIKSNKYIGLILYYNDNPDFISAFENVFKELTEEKPYDKKPDIEFAWEIISELFIKNLKIMQGLLIKENKKKEELIFNHIYNIELEIAETLERKPKENYYTPMDFITLAEKISELLGFVLRKKINLDYDAFQNYNVFSDYEAQKIRKCYNNLFEFIQENKIGQKEMEKIEIEECKKYGDTFDKIKILHKNVSNPAFKNLLLNSKEWIEELYSKIPGNRFSEIKQENKDGDIQLEFDPEEYKYYDFSEEQVVIEDRRKFAKILEQEFKEDDEKDFISFIEKDGPWPVILYELNLYYKKEEYKGKHNNNSLIFTVYKHGIENAAHSLFAHKIKKALSKYEKELKEEKNGKRN